MYIFFIITIVGELDSKIVLYHDDHSILVGNGNR